MNYILGEDGEPRREHDWARWANWMESARLSNELQLALDSWQTSDGHDISVSTVFLGLSIDGDGRDLFETMVFAQGTSADGLVYRWPAREIAEVGHDGIVRSLKDDDITPSDAHR